MKKFLLSLSIASMAITAAPAMAEQPGQGWRQDQREDRREERQDRRDDRRDDRQDRRADRRDDRRDHRREVRDYRQYRNYDWNRPERGQRYDAQRYYRDGRYYQPQRVTRNTRVYRGGDGRYYCRRNDGTTGLIVGAAIGGLLGNRIDNGGSGLLGTLIGACR